MSPGVLGSDFIISAVMSDQSDGLFSHWQRARLEDWGMFVHTITSDTGELKGLLRYRILSFVKGTNVVSCLIETDCRKHFKSIFPPPLYRINPVETIWI